MRKTLILSLIVALVAACSQTPQQKMQSLYATAEEQIDHYQFEKARVTIDEMGELDPGSIFIPYCTGLIHERQLSYQDAVHEYMMVGTVDPTFGPALEGICRAFSRLGEYTNATRAASDNAQQRPADPEARLLLARAMIGLGQYRGAEREIIKAQKLGTSSVLSDLMVARVLHLRNEIDSARSNRERVMADPQESVDFLMGAADLYETVGLIDSAITFGRRALESRPADHDLLLDHFFRCIRVRYFFEARQAIARIEAADGGEVVRTGMWLHYYRATGEHSKAKGASSDYRRLTDASVMSVSLDILARAESSDFLSAGTDMGLLQLRLKKEGYLPDFCDYMVYTLQANSPEVISGAENMDLLRQLSAEYANALEVKLRIAHLMHKIGDFDGYKEFITLLEEYHRSQPDWLTGIADVNAGPIIRKYDQAERLYTRALELNCWYRPAFEKYVAMQRARRLYTEALDLFEQYPYFSELYPAIRLLKALVLAENNRLDEAQTTLMSGARLISGDLTAIGEYLDIMKRRGELDRVDPIIDMLRANTSNADALGLAAIWECERGRYQNGLDLTEQSLAIDPDNVTVYAVKAWAMHGLDHRGEAFDLFEENHRRDRDNVANNVYYSKLLASDKMDLNRASNIARAAAFDGIGDLDVWMNLCYVYFQAERYDLSRGEATKASRSFPYQPEPHFWIGMTNYMEDNPAAKENLQKSVMLGLAGDQLKQAQEALAKL